MKKQNKEIKIQDHQLSISYLSVWIKLIRQNKIDKKKMATRIWLFLIGTLLFQWLQRIIFNWRIKKMDIFSKPPFFILGHWRSGTTHLHYIFAHDKQFAYLSNYQAFLINVSLIGRTWLKWLLSPLMPHKRPQDNIPMHVNYPAEEEQPFSNISIRSGFHSFYFPKNISYHDRFNLFKGIKPRGKRLWKRDYIYLLKLIAYINGNGKLLLKNPHNTSRIKELVSIFPQSKFLFIHRNPYQVFHSSRHLYQKAISTQFLQDFSEAEIEDRVFYNFESTLSRYLQYRELVPKENLLEIGFDELDKNTWPTIERIYEELNLGGLEDARPNINKYLESVKDYEKNVFPDLTPNIIERINKEWDFAFKAWNYDKVNPNTREILNKL